MTLPRYPTYGGISLGTSLVGADPTAPAYYEADDPSSYPGGVLPATLAPATQADVKRARTGGIVTGATFGLLVGVFGTMVLAVYATKWTGE